MKVCLNVLALGLLLGAGAAHAQETPPAPPAAAAAPAVPAEPERTAPPAPQAKAGRVCQVERPLGSNLPKRVCRNADEAQDQTQQARESMGRAMRGG